MWRSIIVYTSVLLSCVSAKMGINNTSGVISNPSAVDGHTFDYIVVGGGLTGLTIAARLSEDTHRTVLVIEAGNDDRTDSRTLDIYRCAPKHGSCVYIPRSRPNLQSSGSVSLGFRLELGC